MAANPVTAFMDITLPVPGQTQAFGVAAPGESWMELQNTGLNTIDQHDHTTGKGAPLGSASIAIDADLDFNDNNAIGLRSTRYTALSLGDLGVSDIGCLIVSGVDLYYVDGSGNQIRITSGGGVVGAPGNITGLTAPAEVDYSSLSKTYTFLSDTTTAGNIYAGSVAVAEAVPSGKAVTLKAPTSLAANYQVTFPAALPGTTKILRLTSAGAIQDALDVDGSTVTIVSDVLAVPTGGIGAAQLATNSVITVKIADANVTKAKLDAANIGTSASSGTFNTVSATLVDVTNLSVTLTTHGRPVQFIIQGDGGSDSFFAAVTATAQYAVIRDGSLLAKYNLTAGSEIPACLVYMDPAPSAASHTYKLQALSSGGGGTANVTGAKLSVIEQ